MKTRFVSRVMPYKRWHIFIASYPFMIIVEVALFTVAAGKLSAVRDTP